MRTSGDILPKYHILNDLEKFFQIIDRYSFKITFKIKNDWFRKTGIFSRLRKMGGFTFDYPLDLPRLESLEITIVERNYNTIQNYFEQVLVYITNVLMKKMKISIRTINPI